MLSGDFWQNMSRQFPPKYSSWGWCYCCFHYLLLASSFFLNAHLTEVHVTVHSDSLSDWTSVQMAQLTSHYPDSSPVVTTQITSNGVSMSRVLFTAATCQMWDSCRAYPRLVFCGLSQSLFTSEGKTPKPEPAAHLQQQFLWSDLHEDVFFNFSFVNTRFFFPSSFT